MGIPFGEIWDLQALGEDCAEDGVYEFLMSAVPLPVTGAAGSPAERGRDQVTESSSTDPVRRRSGTGPAPHRGTAKDRCGVAAAEREWTCCWTEPLRW